jgi:glycosyl transferase family 2
MGPTASESRDRVTGHGAVVLATYRPDPDLFAAQLHSIRNQTLSDFVCLIGADGDPMSVEEMVQHAVPGDNRFRILGWTDRVGFYANFERLLQAVSRDCSWVALSDHDDEWLPDKLERLIPMLARHSLASGQARVVTRGAARVLVEKTNRRVVAPQALLLHNQVTGSLSVLRRELLDIALPFPRMNADTQLHDHWLAMCAAATGGYGVLDEVVQDYVQHAANAVGEAGFKEGERRPFARVRTVRTLAQKYEGGSRLADCVRMCRKLSYGWRSAVISTLLARLPAPPVWLSELGHRATDRAGIGAVKTILYGARSPDVETSTTITFLAGLPGELLHRWGRGAEHTRVDRDAARGTAA